MNSDFLGRQRRGIYIITIPKIDKLTDEHDNFPVFLMYQPLTI